MQQENLLITEVNPLPYEAKLTKGGVLTFQQMVLEINAYLISNNKPIVDRDTFMLFLAFGGIIYLRQFGKRKISVGPKGKKYLDINETTCVSSTGASYETLTFGPKSRSLIFDKLKDYFKFTKSFSFTSKRLSSKELSALKEMVEEDFELEAICFNLARKPLCIYREITRYNIKFPGELKCWFLA